MLTGSLNIKTNKAEDNLEAIIQRLKGVKGELVLSEKEAKDLDREFDRMGKNSTKSINETNKSFSALGSGIQKAGQVLLAYFAFDKLKQIALGAVQIRSEFQRMEAVLTTALGSRSAAQVGMQMISEFAAKTPFAIQELTDSYVKLVNQGFKPTRDEMTALGDLAASTGKQFDQLAEAVIDAQVGEFERLKEFGIRARKEGDQVTFTFKGVQTQVENTEQAIQNYLISLGELESVSGSMSAISETLGGKISNLGDNIDQLGNKVGRFLEDEAAGLLDFFNQVLANAISIFETEADRILEKTAEKFEKLNGELENIRNNKVGERIQEVTSFINGLQKSTNKLEFEMKMLEKAFNEGLTPLEKMKLDKELLNEIYEDEERNLQKIVENYQYSKDRLVDLTSTLEAYKMFLDELKKSQEEYIASQENELGLIEELQKRIKSLTALREKANSTRDIQAYNLALAETREELEELLKLGLQRTEPLELLPSRDTVDDELEGLVSIYEKYFGELDVIGENYTGKLHDRIDEEIKARAEAIEKEKKRLEDLAEFERDIRAGVVDASVELGNVFFDYRSNQIEREYDLLQTKKDQELSIIGENAEGRELIEQKYAAKEEELRREQVKNERRRAIVNRGIALAEIAYNTGIAVTKSVALSPLTFGQPWATFAKILGLLQAGTVVAKPLPQYKDGVFDLDGPGTETSDSIHAKLSKSESVVPAKKSREFGWLLKPMIEDKSFNHEKFERMIMEKYAPQFNGQLFAQQSSRDAELKELKELNRSSRKNRSYVTYLDGKPISDNVAKRQSIKTKITRRNRF